MISNIGPYLVRGEIARSNMAIVFRAWDPNANEEVAIKVLNGARGANPGQRERFARECKVLTQLRHQGIVPVRGVGSHEGIPYLVMALVAGGTLHGDRYEHQARVEDQLAAIRLRAHASEPCSEPLAFRRHDRARDADLRILDRIQNAVLPEHVVGCAGRGLLRRSA